MTDLAVFAAHPNASRGRCHDEPAPQYRDEFQRDRDRIIHSGAFRRLEYKTQVFVNHEGDMFRTRLTHSMEVAQLARTVARVLRLNEDLTETISLAHDLGHTPFGHAGQDELNRCMRDYGGFEHNLQSLRVVDHLERRYLSFPGLNLTFESREGILKHCSRAKALELGEIGERFLQRRQPGLEAQLTDICDSIAYNNHDVDDGLRAGLINLDELDEVRVFRRHADAVRKAWPKASTKNIGHEIIRRVINEQVSDLVTCSQRKLAELAPASIDEVRSANEPLIRFTDDVQEQHQELKRFLNEHVYKHYRVRRMSNKAQRVIAQLFNAFFSDSALLPPHIRKHINKLVAVDPHGGHARGVADYIAGMTDRFAIAEFERIYNPSELS